MALATEDSDKVVQITPTPDSLIIQHNRDHGVYTCQEDGCSFKSLSPSVLGLHKANAHNIRTGAKKGQVYQYFCPMLGCRFNPDSGRFFKTLDLLRTHYMKVHGEKKFKCSNCDRAFGLERDCMFHQRECGQIFVCPDCKKTYNNKKALTMHCLSKGHKKPPELCSKLSKAKGIPEKPPVEKSYLIPLLPKLSPSDKIVIIPLPSVTVTASTNSIQSSGLPNLSLHQNTLCSQTGNPLTTSVHSSPKLLSCYDTKTVKPHLSVSSQTTLKCHTPTQTGVSILEKALKRSKISVSKISKATQKSYPRKRKPSDRSQSNSRVGKSKSRVTVATLTDPRYRNNNLSQNAGSQTLIDDNLNALSYNAILLQDKSTSHTQTCNEEFVSVHGSQENHLYAYNFISPHTNTQNITFNHSIAVVNNVSDSITQTFASFLPLNARSSNHSETQTSLTLSSNSKTQTQDIPALDSSTQTLKLPDDLDGTTDFLNELLTETERNDVDTQTFGCFFSDMMTQTLEEWALDSESQPNCLDLSEFAGICNMTTQTLNEVMDINTQSYDWKSTDSTTKATCQQETMTQTLPPLGVETMTETFGNQHPSFDESQKYDFTLQTQTESLDENNSSVQNSFEYDCIITAQNSMEKSINTPHTVNVIDKNPNSASNSLMHRGRSAISSNNVCVFPHGNSTSSVDTASHPSNSVCRKVSTEDVFSVSDFASQTLDLELSTEDLTLEKLLSDMGTQTFVDENDRFSYDDFFDSSSSFVQETSLSMTDSSCQTLIPFLSDNQTTHDDTKAHIFNDLPWEMATQTSASAVNDDYLWAAAGKKTVGGKDILGMVTQTAEGGVLESDRDRDRDRQHLGSQCQWDNGTQTKWDIWAAGTGDLWEMGTQTGDLLWEMGTQTGNLWEMGTQTGNLLWEIGTQTGNVTGGLWEMGTQTGNVTGGLWEMGTQTGNVTDGLWETGTQTVNLWEMGTQTANETGDLWEMGT